MCACSTNEIKFRSSFRTILARGTRSRVPRCIPFGAWRGSVGRPNIERHATVSPVDHSSGSWPPTPASQGVPAPTPRPVPGDQGSRPRSLWNPSTKGRSCPLDPRPTLRGLDARQPHRGWIATGEISVLPRSPTSRAELRCSPLQPPSAGTPLGGPPAHPSESGRRDRALLRNTLLRPCWLDTPNLQG